jgi:flavin-dependent dehydrogenase
MSTVNTGESQLDVAVVGGSIAGCATAINFRRMGYVVGLFEKKAMNGQAYKQLCTHFIQPHAVPLLAGLGLSHLREPAWSVSTKAIFVTPGGVVDTPGGYIPGQPDSYALNLERRVLDPALRAAASEHDVRFIDDTSVESLREDGAGWTIETRGPAGPGRFRARLVVAADGRRSRLAGQLGNPAESHQNDRAAIFGYFTGIEAPAGDHSVFVMNENDLACTYPLAGGRTELVLFADKARVAGWRGQEERLRQFVSYFAGLAAAPSVAGAVPETGLLGYGDYPSQVRQPVAGNVPFVGDAALSLDPMSGVGCGFALLSADLLANSFANRSLDKDDLEDALDKYRKRFADVLMPHVKGIIGDSLVGKNEATRRRMFQTISGNQELSQKYLALTGRVLLPDEFQSALMRAMMNRAAR